jgi:hypothetical protein
MASAGAAWRSCCAKALGLPSSVAGSALSSQAHFVLGEGDDAAAQRLQKREQIEKEQPERGVSEQAADRIAAVLSRTRTSGIAVSPGRNLSAL